MAQATAQIVDPEMLRAMEVANAAEQAEYEQRQRQNPDLEGQAPPAIQQQRGPLLQRPAQQNPLGQVLNYQRAAIVRGVPQGAQAQDENVIMRVQYMQQSMVTMMCALVMAMISKYVHQIEMKTDNGKEEQLHVETMFQLFSIHWMMATAFNFLLASDPHLENPSSQTLCDFLIGAILGVNVVILIEYLRGFFVEGQDESDFITVLALGLNVMGVISWACIGYILFLIARELMRGRERRQRRLNIIAQMQTIPYGSLAFNLDTTCSICFENFKKDDQVLQLRCHKSHIFHLECISEWVRQSEAKCPLCKSVISVQ